MEVDHSKNLLMELPEEIVEMVLRHLDPDARREAVLVCQAFYEHICRLERDSCILNISQKMLTDDDTFNSMMSSKRRISWITAQFCEEDIRSIERLIDVISNFKKHMKSLVISDLLQCSKEDFYKILNAASEVEELTLSFSRFLAAPRRFVQLNKFKKLKRLFLGAVPKVNEILDEVPDNSLEKFAIGNLFGRMSDQNLQAFLNRQRRIVELDVPNQNVDIGHLVLENLTFIDTNVKQFLKTQPLLRSLETYLINDEDFSQICQMRNLEKLSVMIDTIAEDSFGALRNLRKLKELEMTSCFYGLYWPNFFILSQVELPTLQKLVLKFSYWMTADHFTIMGRNFPNLEYLHVETDGEDLLAVIIDEFVALKTLHYNAQYVQNQSRPNHQNQTLEELKIYSLYGTHSLESVCFSINACPNLKRIQILDADFPEDLIMEIVQQHPRLTHFSAEVSQTFRVRNRFEPEAAWMLEIIDIFRSSPHFILLNLRCIHNCQQVKESLRFDDFKVTISETDYGDSNLMITKKSSIRDPYKNFAL